MTLALLLHITAGRKHGAGYYRNFLVYVLVRGRYGSGEENMIR